MKIIRPFKDYDDDFDAEIMPSKRMFGIAAAIGIIWILFVMGAVATVIWALGRFVGVW